MVPAGRIRFTSGGARTTDERGYCPARHRCEAKRNRRDLLRQAFLAVYGFREARNDIPVLTAETALQLATIDGARAVGMEDEIGSLEPRKRAVPAFQDPVDSVVFDRGSATVATVLVDGEVILDKGRYIRLDAEDAYRRIDALVARLEAELGPRRFAEWPHVP